MKTETPFYFNEEKYTREKKHFENKVPALQCAIDAYYQIKVFRT